MGEDLPAYAGLAAAAFGAATLLPGSSEVVLVGLLAADRGEPWLLVALATLANTLGSLVNWAMGRFLLRYRDRRWFPVSAERLERWTAIFRRYGLVSLLFAWAPVGGDALTVAAGIARVPILPFLALVGMGKLLRYVAVALATLGLLPG